MSKQEKIVCAAVRKWVRELEKFTLCVYYPKEYPQRSAAVGDVGYEQGFITNKNRFIDPVEAMKIAVKTGQYPDYELMKRKALEEIGFAKENENHNESAGILGFKLFVADIPKLVSRVKDLDKLLERDYLKPEDLY